VKLKVTLWDHRLRVFENRVLRKMFRTKRKKEQEAGEYYVNEEHDNLYASINIAQVIDSRSVRGVG
jgi:hypothetical protein